MDYTEGTVISSAELGELQALEAEIHTPELEEAIAPLKSMMGFHELKRTIQTLISLVKNSSEQQGVVNEQNYHMVFSGAPGTGKTTAGRLFGKIFKALGILKTSTCIEVSRADLVGPYMGISSAKTREIVNSAVDGVLFIDEAYTLKHDKHDSFGQEVIDSLIKGMEDYRGRLVVIMAGYTEEMQTFLELNPGLRFRFQNIVHFANFTAEELVELVKRNVAKANLFFDDMALESTLKYFQHLIASKDPAEFDNARAARRFSEEIMKQYAIHFGQPGFNTGKIDLQMVKEITKDVCIEENTESRKKEVKENTASYESAIAELNALTGLKNAKEAVKYFIILTQFAQEKENKGLQTPTRSHHMIFTGAPGTGKTTVARRLGRIFKSLGILASDKVVEAKTCSLVGKYVGISGMKTQAVIDAALDGILYIEDAPALLQDENDRAGLEAINALLKGMEEHYEHLIVIFSGDKKGMHRLTEKYPGMLARFEREIEFENYTSDDLMKMWEEKIAKDCVTITPNGYKLIHQFFHTLVFQDEFKFLNAHTVNKIYDKAIEIHAENDARTGYRTNLLTESEIRQAIEYFQK